MPNPLHPYIGRVFTPTEDAEIVGGGYVYADILVPAGDDLKTKTPSIGVVHNGRVILMLTWDDANELGDALHRVAGVAEHG